MEPWQNSLTESVTDLKELAKHYPVNEEALRPVVERYPVRITPYYLSLIRNPGDPIWLQCVPDPRELAEDDLSTDPLSEETLSPLPGLIHRYPDRVVLLVSSTCPTHCRFCLRRWRIEHEPFPADPWLKYIRVNAAIRDVILSGGEPLSLPDEPLEEIIAQLRKLPHIQMVRIHTRVPVTLPNRITARLCRILKRFHPLYVSTHFNHPLEITHESSEACARLADAGIPLGNQTVLLKGVNDKPEVMKELVQKLLTIRVRPYYIHQMDLVKGTGHFRTSVNQGLRIISSLRGYTSGLATPHYVVDLPGGKGKVPMLPDALRRRGKTFLLRNYQGEVVEYPDTGE